MTPELPAHPRVAATHGPGYSSGTHAISSTTKTHQGFSCKLLAFVSELQRSSPSPRAVKEAGGTLLAGSDAPVDTRDPRPFVNMAIGVTRRIPGQQPQNPSQAVGIRDVIDTYTINGARFLHRDAVAGSLEVETAANQAQHRARRAVQFERISECQP